MSETESGSLGRVRILKREFLDRVAARSGVSRETVEIVYDALQAEIISTTRMGTPVVLTGFGRFYRQNHKGHTVQFGRGRVNDYSVLKFSSLRGVNRLLDAPMTSADWDELEEIDSRAEEVRRLRHDHPELSEEAREPEGAVA